MSNSRLTQFGMAAVAILLLAWVVLTLASGKESQTGAAEIKGRCPECGKPLPKSAQLAGECPFCRIEKGPKAAKLNRGKKSLAQSPIIPIILVGVFIVLLAAHLGIIVRSRVTRSAGEALHHYHCPKCARKLRYRDSQIGKVSQCPICKRPLMFPAPPPPPPKQSLHRTLLRRLFSSRADGE